MTQCNCSNQCNPCQCKGQSEAQIAPSMRRGIIIKLGRRALLKALLRRGYATIDDVRAKVALLPGVNPKVFGCVPEELVTLGMIERVGYKQTDRPVAHARTVSIWRLADREAAKRWLKANPALSTGGQNAEKQGLLFPIVTDNEPGAAAATVTPGMEGL